MGKGTRMAFYKLIIYLIDQNSSSVFYSSSCRAAHYNIKNWKCQIVLNPRVTRVSNRDFRLRKTSLLALTVIA
jgi:hypothetical protein